MANIGSLRTTISLDSAQFEQGMAGVNRQLKSLQQEQKAVTSSGTGFARGLTEMRSKADVLSRTFELQQGKVQELKRRYDEAREATGENSRETQRAQEQYNKAVAEMNKTENALKNLTVEIERQENPWNQLSESMKDSGKKLRDVGKGMTDFGKSWSTRVTLPVLGLAGAALKVGMDFEQGMSKVQSISGATGEDLQAMSDQAKELGETTRFSATEAASGMEFLAMAGFETSEILSAMPGLLDLAASSNMDLGRAADIASNILSGFGYEADEAGRVADVLAKGASTANTNVEQLGGAMKYVAPVASALGLEIEELTAGVGLMSDAGIQGEQAGRVLRQGLLRLANPTGAAADLIKDLGINAFDADGSMKDLDQVVAELENGLGGMSDKARTAALSTIFGAESVAGWTALIDRGSDELNEYTGELENAEGAASDMAATMQDNARGKIVEFQSALEGIGIALAEHMIPAVTDAVEWGTELVRKFGELDDSTQENIVKIGLFAAAIGPAAIVAGSMTTALGNILQVGGKVVGMLGTTGGAGLVGRVGLLGAGASTPVGLAIAGTAALAGGIYLLTRDTEELHDISTKTAEGLLEQSSSLEELADKYDELQGKSNLTNEEFARYVDLQGEMEKATDPETIFALHQEMENLRKKSGMSNDELDEMIGLNNDLVEQSPTVEKSFTDKGNAVVESTDAVREYIDSLRDMAVIELEAERVKALENEATLRRENREIGEEIKVIEEDIQRILEMREMPLEAVRSRIEEIQGMQYDTNLSAEEQNELQRELTTLLDIESGKIVESLEHMQEQRDTLLEKQELNNDEIAKLEQINKQLEMAYLQNVGINDEKAEQAVHEGKSIDVLDEQLDNLREQKRELQQTVPVSEQNTGEYRKAVGEIDNQIGKLQTAKRNVEGLTSEAEKYTTELGADVDKNVNVKSNPTIASLNRELTSPLTRFINLRTRGIGLPMPGYAKGTDYHPGGIALTGEEGPELARIGNRWSMLGFGIHDLPQGTQVFTHDESKKIISALNNMPAYASGTNMGAETNRIVNHLNESQATPSSQPLVLEIHLTSEIDGRVAGKAIESYVTEIQERKRKVVGDFAQKSNI